MDLLSHQFGQKNVVNQTALMTLAKRQKLHILNTREIDSINRLLMKEIKH